MSASDGKKKKQTIILAGLGLVLTAVLGKQLLGGAPPAAQATQTGAQMPERNAAENLPEAAPTVASVFKRADVNLDTLVQEIKVVEFEYDKDTQERDPTIPLAGDALKLRVKTMIASAHRTPEDIVQAAKQKHVTGIIWDGATPYAVIDNNVVSKGFTFDEAIFVKAIEKDHVVLGIEGQDTEVVAELKEQ